MCDDTDDGLHRVTVWGDPTKYVVATLPVCGVCNSVREDRTDVCQRCGSVSWHDQGCISGYGYVTHEEWCANVMMELLAKGRRVRLVTENDNTNSIAVFCDGPWISARSCRQNMESERRVKTHPRQKGKKDEAVELYNPLDS